MKDVIILKKNKFSQEDLKKLNAYREIAYRCRCLYPIFLEKYNDSTTRKERDLWKKNLDLIDLIRSNFEDSMFCEFPELPDDALRIFY